MKISHFSSKAAIAFVALASAVLSACSSGNDITTPDVPQTKESTLTIDLKPVETRAAAKDATTDNENKINRVAVGIFGKDGNVKVVKTFESITEGKVSLTTSAALTTADHVLVACNAPASTFTGSIPNESAFRAKTITIDEALYGATSHTTENAVDITNLPMFGHTEALTQDANNGTVFTASVNVYHLVAKVTLESFTLEQVGAMANARFVPEGIFLAHVPDQLDFQNVTATSTSAAYFTDPALSYSNYYHGCMTKKPTTDNANADFLGKAYLGMDATTSTTDQSKSVDGLVAYTMPNSKTDDEHATFLVVRGKFYFNSSDTEGTEVWYPLYINYSTDETAPKVGDAKKVYPNFNYKMTVTVKGFGETPAYDENGNPVIKALVPKTVSVTVKPVNFVEASSTVILE